MYKVVASIIGLLVLAFASHSHAAAIQCGGPDRYAELDSATMCSFGLGNPTQSTIDGYFGNTPSWEDAGELTGNGTDNYLTAELTSGSWGGVPVAGNWSIDASFWSEYDNAVISMHVGNGGGDPDHFAWLLEDGETSGTWSYWIDQNALNDNGGGLSNFRLWGQKGSSTTEVPEPATLALIAFGLLGLGLSRKVVS